MTPSYAHPWLQKMTHFVSLVKFSHTLFALPFALLGLTLGLVVEHQPFRMAVLLYVLGCMVTARNVAMAFNRLVDASFDKKNERTRMRDIPQGNISHTQAIWFITINAVLFIFFAAQINTLCFYLSPVALTVIMGYSFTKRFTFLCHLILGIALALAPIGAFLAITGYFKMYILVLGINVLLWVSGFDIIYALQDKDFDQQNQLWSIPVWLGQKKALLVSQVVHALTFMGFVILGTMIDAGIIYGVGTVVFGFFLIRQHRQVNLNDLTQINPIFFLNNGIASLLYCALAMIDVLFFKG